SAMVPPETPGTSSALPMRKPRTRSSGMSLLGRAGAVSVPDVEEWVMRPSLATQSPVVLSMTSRSRADLRAPTDVDAVSVGVFQRRPCEAVFVEGRYLLCAQGHSPLDVGRIVRVVEVDVQRVLPLCPIVDLDEEHARRRRFGIVD